MSDAREAMINVALDLLKAYGTTMSSAQRVGQLPLMYSVRCIPLFILAMLKYVSFMILFAQFYFI